MTTREHNALQNFFNQLTEVNKAEDEAFSFLQDKNGEVNGNRWCCAEINYKELLKAGHDYTRVYDTYVAARAKYDAISDLGVTLANLGFWKKQRDI